MRCRLGGSVILWSHRHHRLWGDRGHHWLWGDHGHRRLWGYHVGLADGRRHDEHHLDADIAREHVRGEERWQWLWASEVRLDPAVIPSLVCGTDPVVNELIVLHRMVAKASRGSRGAFRIERAEETLVLPLAIPLLLNGLALQDGKMVPGVDSTLVVMACDVCQPSLRRYGLVRAVRLVVAQPVSATYGAAPALLIVAHELPIHVCVCGCVCVLCASVL